VRGTNRGRRLERRAGPSSMELLLLPGLLLATFSNGMFQRHVPTACGRRLPDPADDLHGPGRHRACMDLHVSSSLFVSPCLHCHRRAVTALPFLPAGSRHPGASELSAADIGTSAKNPRPSRRDEPRCWPPRLRCLRHHGAGVHGRTARHVLLPCKKAVEGSNARKACGCWIS
jgi:hypothetical protein